jgi:hypothetical protein
MKTMRYLTVMLESPPTRSEAVFIPSQKSL